MVWSPTQDLPTQLCEFFHASDLVKLSKNPLSGDVAPAQGAKDFRPKKECEGCKRKMDYAKILMTESYIVGTMRWRRWCGSSGR